MQQVTCEVCDHVNQIADLHTQKCSWDFSRRSVVGKLAQEIAYRGFVASRQIEDTVGPAYIYI